MLFVVYDILQIISYLVFRFRRYFEEAWNYLDWLCYGLLASYFLLQENQEYSTKVTRVLGSSTLIVLYYRSFSYLRVFESFTTLVGMINTIIQKLAVFFVILVYFCVSCSFLVLKLSLNRDPLKSLSEAYVWTFFGGIGASDFESFDLAAIPIVFGTIMVTVVLLNVLIAYLSNLFSRLEDQQKSDNYREKASMVLDLEVVLHFFGYWLTGKTRCLETHDRKDRDFYPQAEIYTPQKTKDLLKDRKTLYILKTVNFEASSKEASLDDNIYKKVKGITRRLDAFESKVDRHFASQSQFRRLVEQELKSCLETQRVRQKEFMDYVKGEFEKIRKSNR